MRELIARIEEAMMSVCKAASPEAEAALRELEARRGASRTTTRCASPTR